jgi:hypothetical protein
MFGVRIHPICFRSFWGESLLRGHAFKFPLADSFELNVENVRPTTENARLFSAVEKPSLSSL